MAVLRYRRASSHAESRADPPDPPHPEARRLDDFYDAVWVLCQAQAERMPPDERERFLADQRAMIEGFRLRRAG